MFERAKKSLSKIFMAAVLAAAVFTPAIINTNTGDKPTYQAIDQTSTELAWQDLSENWSFKYDAEHPGILTPNGTNTLTVQLESSVNELDGITLSDKDDPQNILERHGEAVTYILDKYADKFSGFNIDVRLIEPAETLVNTFFKVTNPSTHALMAKADIIGLSMVFIPPSYNLSNGKLSQEEDIAEADKLWLNNDAILVWSAGNAGLTSFPTYPRPAAYHTMRADTMVRIGEVSTGSDGVTRIADHSDRGGVSFVVRNPYTDPTLNESYKYIRSSSDLRDRLNMMYNLVVTDHNLTAEQVFYDQLVVRQHYPKTYPNVLDANPLMLLGDIHFSGKGILLDQTAEWHRNNPEVTRQAFINALIAAIPYAEQAHGADKHGNISSLPGTSFAQPYANAMITAAHEIYPQLSEFELIAAALIAAEPVTEVEIPTSNSKASLLLFSNTAFYYNNGRNLHYNDKAGGFGLVEPDQYFDVLEQMANMLTTNSSLSTEQAFASSGPQNVEHNPEITTFDDGETLQHNSYEVEVNEDIVAMRTNIRLKFKGDHNAVPANIQIINPQNKSITIAPTNIRGSSAEYSLATTDGHFGNHTAGTWQIKFNGEYELEAVQIDIHGSEIGGLIDAYLHTSVDQEKVPEVIGQNTLRFEMLLSDPFESLSQDNDLWGLPNTFEFNIDPDPENKDISDEKAEDATPLIKRHRHSGGPKLF